MCVVFKLKKIKGNLGHLTYEIHTERKKVLIFGEKKK